LNIPGIFQEADWFWTFSVAIMDGSDVDPVTSKRWAISKDEASSFAEAFARINRHLREESRLQASVRPNRWVAVFPMDGTPQENLNRMRHFWRGEPIPTGSMLRSQAKAPNTPEIVQFQLSLW